MFVNSFTNLEMIIISTLIPIIRLKCDSIFLNPILYYQILTINGRCAISQVIDVFFVFEIELYVFFWYFMNLLVCNLTLVLFCALMCILLSISMVFCYKISNVNLGRKSVHFALFLILLRIDNTMKEILGMVLLLNHVISANFSDVFICRYFRSERDIGQIIVSNTLILSGCYFSSFFLTYYEDYVFVLISMMILDSVTSIIGKMFECKRKNKKVAILGVLSAIFTHFAIFRNFRYVMFYIFIGVLEYKTHVNDNLVIPIVSTILLMYFKPN